MLAVNFRATKYRVEARSATKEEGEKTAPKRQQLVVQDKDILPPVRKERNWGIHLSRSPPLLRN